MHHPAKFRANQSNHSGDMAVFFRFYISGSQMSVRPSTKIFLDCNEIWCVGRGRRVMHDGMQYDPIQGQSQGYERLKVGNSTIFKGSLLPHL